MKNCDPDSHSHAGTQDRLHTQLYYSRALFEANSDAMVLADTRGIIFDVNEKMEEITGYTRCELIGINWFDFFPNTVPAGVEFAQVLGQNRVSNIKLVIKNRDGSDLKVIYDEAAIFDCNAELVGVIARLYTVTQHSTAV